MAENSNIEWCDHTFNPWIGCTKVSPACDNCYAEDWAKRYRPKDGLWSGNLHRTSEANWKKVHKWDKEARDKGEKRRVFCASLADVFDNQAPSGWRYALWGLIANTPNLDWLLLTKRPQNIKKMLPEFWDEIKDRVWLGTTVENQKEADRRIPILMGFDSAVRFISYEPALELINIDRLDEPNRDGEKEGIFLDGYTGDLWDDHNGVIDGAFSAEDQPHPIDWIIAGCESGPKRRSSELNWFRKVLFNVRLVETILEKPRPAFFMKQMVIDGKVTGDISKFPKELQVREFPKVRAA